MRVKYYIVKFVNEFERYLAYNSKVSPVGVKKIKLQEQPTIFFSQAEAEAAVTSVNSILDEELEIVEVV